jgi:hypothetical protein
MGAKDHETCPAGSQIFLAGMGENPVIFGNQGRGITCRIPGGGWKLISLPMPAAGGAQQQAEAKVKK